MNNTEVTRLLNVGIALSEEKDHFKLLRLILTEAMDITKADAGTLYLCRDNRLDFKIMYNKTMKKLNGEDGGVLKLPPVTLCGENVCAYAAIQKKLVNIADVNNSTEFQFTGPKRYDELTGYHTQSMLVVPIKNSKNQVTGVIQLINSIDEQGKIVPFDSRHEMFLQSFASQVAVSIANAQHIKDERDFFDSFVRMISCAIDTRSKYNGNHTRRVAQITENFINYINQQHKLGLCTLRFSERDSRELVMSAWLHDVGKLVIPIEVMNKATRLGSMLESVMTRLELVETINHLDHALGQITDVQLKGRNNKVEKARTTILRVNCIECITDKLKVEIMKITKQTYRDISGEHHFWLTDEEAESLAVSTGTLTFAERQIIQQHVVETDRLLSNLKLNGEYEHVRLWASLHHERSDGSGYPNGLFGEDIPVEAQLLAIVDVFEALISNDRPYKRPVDEQWAKTILINMAEDGKFDKWAVELFINSEAWVNK